MSLAKAFNQIVEAAHGAAFKAGWWTDLETGEDLRQAKKWSIMQSVKIIRSRTGNLPVARSSKGKS